MSKGVCSFMNALTKACCICNVRKICPRKCNGINGKEGTNCDFFKSNETCEVMCLHETNIKNGRPLDEDSMLYKLDKKFEKINILLRKEEESTKNPIITTIESENLIVED
ncbi:hypothetical protein HF520_01435 [Romboutsia sp. CE17]|uniref:hypothetical protein n=1 Tax=Romboutsia sp. CE17 TaxID=2724150 RepID=UPI001442DD74|nr:hypothetical protein [Romboutsia sp. CE17]QJA07686.1 hypothetical protein HF520_01435 [Romboutsia sp. CE17]